MNDSPGWPKRWQPYKAHRTATVKQWDSGAVKAYTARNERKAQYNPHLYNSDESVRELEMACVESGTLISRTDKRLTFYMRHPDDQIIGACSGEETCFVFAEWLSSGEIHGRPISVDELKKKGVRL